MKKLIDINIEGRKHIEGIIDFLKSEKPDIICMQEVFEEDFKRLKGELKMEGIYSPMSDRSIENEHYNQFYGVWGVSILHNPLENVRYKNHYYVGRGTIPIFINNYSDDRVLQILEFEEGNKMYRIGNTHFYFTPNGRPDEGQWKALSEMMKYLKEYEHILFTGDFNAPRGREIFQSINEHYIDWLPKDIESTIDPNLHKVKGLSLVVDTIFSTSHYEVNGLRLEDGLSDHKAIVANIKRIT